jgi:TP901 family phage tail tape measure protein
MANIGNITAGINVDTAGLRRGLFSASKELKAFTAGPVAGFANLAKNVAKVTVAIGALGTALTATAIIKGTIEFVKFEDALLDLQKVMSDTEGSAKQFIGVTEELSNKFAKASSEVLQGAANFKQAGFTVQEAFELQEVALRSATVSELGVVDSSKILIRILKGFKAPASEAARVLDIMNEVSNQFATSLGELSIGMSDLSPVAKLMGFSFEETAAVLTPIIEVFGSGSEAAIAMRTSMLRLVSTQSTVQKTLKALQINQKDVNGQFRKGRDILFDVAQRFKLLDENQKIFVAGQLVGIRQASRFVEVANNLPKVLAVQKVALESAGSAMKEQEIRLASLGIQLGKTKTEFNNMARRIGEFFSPAVAEASKAMINLMAAFDPTTGRFASFTTFLDNTLSKLGKILARLLEISGFGPAPGISSEQSDKDVRGTRVQASLVRLSNTSNIGTGGVVGSRPGFQNIVNTITNQPDNLDKELQKLVKDSVNGLDTVEQKNKEVMDAMAVATTGWANNFSRELTDVLFGAELTFGNILESFAKMITQMFIQLSFINPLLQSAFGESVAGGTGSGFLSGIGGAFKNIFKAEGGIATHATAGIFGEAGPEALIPLDRLNDFGGGGGDVTINIIGAPENTRVEETESEGGKTFDVIIDDIVSESIRPGTKTFQKMNSNLSGVRPKIKRR